MIKKVNVYKWNKKVTLTEDYVCVEQSYEIYIQYENFEELIAELNASPSQLRELGAGFAVCEGYVDLEKISDVRVRGNKIYILYKDTQKEREEERSIQYPPCGDPYLAKEKKEIRKIASEMKISVEVILKIISMMSRISEIWKMTGGTHWAALFDKEGKKIVHSEDIGRYNAVDKVVGYAVLNKISLDNTILASSGRMPYAMVKKAANAGIPIIITKSPPTDKGIQLAKEKGITLIGFARGRRFTIYTGEGRIIF